MLSFALGAKKSREQQGPKGESVSDVFVKLRKQAQTGHCDGGQCCSAWDRQLAEQPQAGAVFLEKSVFPPLSQSQSSGQAAGGAQLLMEAFLVPGDVSLIPSQYRTSS